MNLLQLHQYAENNCISIDYFNLGNTLKGMGVKYQGKNHIALNNHILKSEKDERLVLAHELGHATANAFYTLAKLENPRYKGIITRAENLGNRTALTLLVPIDELKTALEKTVDIYELADIFDVETDTIHKVIEYYKSKKMLQEKEFDN